MTEQQKDYGLILDEMSLDVCEKYCKNTQQLVGTTTLPASSCVASKRLVLLLVGISDRCKQVTGFEYTSNSISKGCIKQLVVTTINIAKSIGLQVHFLSFDSGVQNQRMLVNFVNFVNFGKDAVQID